jgi:hypothetical protein
MEKEEKPVAKVVIEASNEELQVLGMQYAVFLLGTTPNLMQWICWRNLRS